MLDLVNGRIIGFKETADISYVSINRNDISIFREIFREIIVQDELV